MSKEKATEEVVQQIDLTELVNYVNYLGDKVTELSQASQPKELKFGMEVVETEGSLSGIKYFHTVVTDGFCSGIGTDIKDFYAKKYGVIPEVLMADFYGF